MITKERLESIKENVYMRSEIAKISGLGIDTSLREELELIEEIDRLNNIINELENDLKKRKHTYENMNASINGVVVGCFTYVLKKLQELKDSDKNDN